MNFLIASLIALFLPTCTITITDTSAPKKKPVAKHGHSSSAKKKQTVSKPQSSNVKESWWVENYQKLESARGNYTIPDDANIEPLPDGRFKVPDTVLSHYQDLLLAKPTSDN